MSIPTAGPPIFGAAPEGIVCRRRAAAYAVIHDADGKVACVRGQGRRRTCFWLPGGGALAGETPEDTVVREVREELGRAIRLLNRMGEAIQYFHASDEGCWYEMRAVFFRAEFTAELPAGGEHELLWIDVRQQAEHFFHACHVWAACPTGSPPPGHFLGHA